MGGNASNAIQILPVKKQVSGGLLDVDQHGDFHTNAFRHASAGSLCGTYQHLAQWSSIPSGNVPLKHLYQICLILPPSIAESNCALTTTAYSTENCLLIFWARMPIAIDVNLPGWYTNTIGCGAFKIRKYCAADLGTCTTPPKDLPPVDFRRASSWSIIP